MAILHRRYPSDLKKEKKSLVVKNTKKESIKNKYSKYKRREESSSYNEVNQIHTDDKRQ